MTRGQLRQKLREAEDFWVQTYRLGVTLAKVAAADGRPFLLQTALEYQGLANEALAAMPRVRR